MSLHWKYDNGNNNNTKKNNLEIIMDVLVNL